MMRWIIRSSLKLRLVVAAAAALLLVFGFTQLRHMPFDALPEFSRPYVEVQTEALGLSAAEVEALITTPLEADLLNGVSWVDEIRSESIPGLSSIVMIFEKGTDIMRARQMVQERLIGIHALPNVSTPPTMINPLSSASRCVEIGLTSEELSLIEMSVLARWTIQPRLMGVPGVANVSIWGQRKRQLQVQIDPEKLRREEVSLMQIIRTTGNALWVSPLSFLEASTPGTGGWIDTPNQRLGIRHLLPINKAEDLAQVTIEGATSKRLGDVAMVVEDHQPLIGDAIVNDASSLMLVVEKFPWANTKDVTQGVEKALAALRPGLAGLEMDPTLFRPATFLDSSVSHLLSTLLISAVLLVVALGAFLFNWRTTLVSVVSLLLSVVVAAAVLYLRNVEMNLMIIAGFMVALALIIDDAIIDSENVLTRLREARKDSARGSVARVIFDAVAEMRTPLLYGTLIMILAVAPVLFLEGVSGAFLQPLVATYMIALVSSLVVALTVTPALSLLLLRKTSLQGSRSPVSEMLRDLGSGLAGWIARTPRPVFAGVCVLVVVSIFALPFLRQESLLPDLKETDLVVRWQGSSGTSHPAMSRITSLASRELRDIPGVRKVSAHLGRAIMSDKRTGINSGELWVSIDPAAEYDKTVAAVKDVVAGYPGLSPEVLTFLQSKVREELSGRGEALVVRVYGEDMDVIRQKAEHVKSVLAGIAGITDAKVQYPDDEPTLEIEVNLDKAKQYGLKPGNVRRSATSLMSGLLVGNLFEEQKVFDVVVYGSPETRHSLSSLENLLIDTPNGDYVRLKDVADVRIVPAATVIHRDAVSRRMDVTARVRGRDLAAVAQDVESGIRKIDFPLEYRAELLGEYAERLAAQERIFAFACAAAIGIFLLLQAYFKSWRLAAAVFLTLPMAIVGGLVAAFLTGGGLLSLGSMIGFIAVLGIAVRHSLVLIGRYRAIERANDNTFAAELIARGTQDRFAPILITNIVIALVMLPFAIAGSVAGLEIVHPLAVVVLGGLVTSTLYALAGIPALYSLFGAAREDDLELLPVRVVGEAEMHEVISSPHDMEKS